VDGLFNSPVLHVEQPGKVLETQAIYEIVDNDRRLLARVAEVDKRSRMQLLRWALPGSLTPGTRALAVTGPDDGVRYVLTRLGEGWVTELRLPDGEPAGHIRVTGTGRQYTLTDGAGKTVGRVTGDLKLRSFSVFTRDGTKIGQVTKRWAGLKKELLTASDHYLVEFTGKADEPLRTLAVMLAVVLDLSFYGPT
jgi:Scramblase